jgi:hypothetical protein
MDNPFKLKPFKLNVINIRQDPTIYIFLGNIPPAVLSAANSFTKAGQGLKWDSSAEKILKTFYGARWKQILSPRRAGPLTCDSSQNPLCDNGYIGARKDIHGGNQFDDFDNITMDDSGQVVDTNKYDDNSYKTNSESIIYSNISIYPEDTIEDIKNKIFIATNIQYCKQHLFYYIDGQITTTYDISIDESVIKPDILKFLAAFNADSIITDRSDNTVPQNNGSVRRGDTIIGVPIDKHLEKYKNDIIIDPLEPFTSIVDQTNNPIYHMYVVNIDSVLNLVKSDIKSVIKDKYQVDLFYYGFVLKYWPAFSMAAFKTLIMEPQDMEIKYPYLFRSYTKTKNMLEAEQSVIDSIYNRSKQTILRQQEIEDYDGIAVTRAKLFISPSEIRFIVNVRNIFDVVRVSKYIPAIVANVHPFDMGITDQMDNFVLEKTHISVASYRYGPGASKSIDKFIKTPFKRSGVNFLIVQNKTDNINIINKRIHFVYLTIYYDGYYHIESTWDESDRINFTGIINRLTTVINPIIDTINKYKDITLPLGNVFDISGNRKTKLGSLVINTYWPHALSDLGFKNMKNRLKKYEDAGIISIRSNQQPGTYTFYFRKNITKRESSFITYTLDKRMYSMGIKNTMINKYDYLTNPDIRNIWNNVYVGRMVKLHQKSTLLTLEIINVDIDEFRFINTYMLTFLDSLIYGPDPITGVINPSDSKEDVSRLRTLQEQDPNLFNLRQFDSNAVVYSILCQGERQPEILTKKNAKKYNKSEITKFWNFTEQHSAYYRCPSKKYPYLQFSVGKHPLGYCIPCCKKTKIVNDSRAFSKTNKCLTKFKIENPTSDGLQNATRHILTYGKEISIGRISFAPPSIADDLLYKSLDAPFVYRLIGVVQKTDTMVDAGFFYAIASAFEYESQDFVKELVDTINVLGDSYVNLANGSAAIFATIGELTDAIKDTFINTENEDKLFSVFGPGGQAHNIWKDLIISLIRIRFDIEIVEFIDVEPDASGRISEYKLSDIGNMIFKADAVAINKLKNSNNTLCNIAIIITNKLGSYPFVAMDQKTFIRHTRGYGPARRFFSSEYNKGEFNDSVVKSLRQMLLTEVKYKCIGSNKYLDLDTISLLCEKHGYTVEYNMINIRSMCYGVIIRKDESGDKIFYPIPYSAFYLKPKVEGKSSAYIYDGFIPTEDSGNPIKYPANILNDLFIKFNTLFNLEIINKMVYRSGKSGDIKIIGFICKYECIASSTLTFYHDEINPDECKKYSWGDAPDTEIPYNIRDINNIIYDKYGIADPGLSEDKIEIINKTNYLNSLYELFVAEFIASIKDYINKPMRTTITNIINKSNFSTSAGIIEFVEKLSAILDRKDLSTFKNFIKSYTVNQNMKTVLLKDLENNKFVFDRVIVNNLRKLDSEPQIIKELDILMSKRVHFIDDKDKPTIDNIYIACSIDLPNGVDGQSHCKKDGVGKKLMITKKYYESYLSILASDILNPNKSDSIYLLTSGVIDSFKFTTFEGELIKISS